MPRKRKRSETFVDVETIDSTDPLGLESGLSPSKRRYIK